MGRKMFPRASYEECMSIKVDGVRHQVKKSGLKISRTRQAVIARLELIEVILDGFLPFMTAYWGHPKLFFGFLQNELRYLKRAVRDSERLLWSPPTPRSKTKGGIVKNSKLCLFLALLFGIGSLQAQGTDSQVRFLIHPTIQMNQHWFIAVWQIDNLKAKATNNANLFSGLGYRGRTLWIEGMIWRQWSSASNQWVIDVRFQKKFRDRITLYIEPSPFLSKRAFYELVVLETRAWWKLNFGLETENTHRAGPDSFGLGPRISFPILAKPHFKLALAAVYQFRLGGEPNVIRLYPKMDLPF